MYRRLVLLSFIIVSCVSCAMTPKVVQRELLVPDTLAQAYTKAVRATMAVGGTVRSQDRESGAISATVQNVVSLNVTVQPEGQGSKVTVQGQVPPTHVTFGAFSLTDDWARAYQQQQ